MFVFSTSFFLSETIVVYYLEDVGLSMIYNSTLQVLLFRMKGFPPVSQEFTQIRIIYLGFKNAHNVLGEIMGKYLYYKRPIY